jgi:hypothetical protein
MGLAHPVRILLLAAAPLAGCLAVGTPPAGRAVAAGDGQTLVFGGIRMVDEAAAGTEYAPLRWDPWDEPFFGPGPRMTLELRQLQPPGGAIVYRSLPAPRVEDDGAFYWLLAPGEYELLGNPRLPGSKRFTTAETTTLARFTVTAGEGTLYVGTLVLAIRYDLEDMVRGWKRGEAEYELRSRQVVDERDAALARLRARFPAFPEPALTDLMRPE